MILFKVGANTQQDHNIHFSLLEDKRRKDISEKPILECVPPMCCPFVTQRIERGE